jgi:hypothetical protein
MTRVLLKREGYSISHRPVAVEARVKSIGVVWIPNMSAHYVQVTRDSKNVFVGYENGKGQTK